MFHLNDFINFGYVTTMRQLLNRKVRLRLFLAYVEMHLVTIRFCCFFQFSAVWLAFPFLVSRMKSTIKVLSTHLGGTRSKIPGK